jgi:hypothetical protein
MAFTLLPQANASGAQTFPTAKMYDIQHHSDQKFARQLQSLSKDQLSKTVVIDARLNNGAMDSGSLPPSTDVLGYSAWGTGGNNFGQGLAMAKIVAYAQDQANKNGEVRQAKYVNAARRQLVVESIAHDVFLLVMEKGLLGHQWALCGITHLLLG